MVQKRFRAQIRVLVLLVMVLWSAFLLAACGSAEVEFAVKHLRD